MIHIVLINPKMPSNTGNIIRLCANTGASLHLMQPLGFDLDDKKLRRAGLDYHEYANLQVHADWQAVKARLNELSCTRMVALTTKLSRSFYDYKFFDDEFFESVDQTTASISALASVALIFGSETSGLPEEIRADIGAENWLRLPMLPDSRSLNLSNSVAICLYEVWRQQRFIGDVGESVGYHQLSSQPSQLSR